MSYPVGKIISRLAALVLTIVVAVAVYSYLYPVDLGKREVSIVISHGDPFSKVSRQLADSGVIRSEFLLKMAARLRGIDMKLTPGLYDFSGNQSIRTVLGKLEDADFRRVKVTIPEGSPIWEVASILSDRMGYDSAALVQLNEDTAFLDSLDRRSLEGCLYPETYFFAWGLSLRQAVREMVALFETTTAGVWPDEIILDMSRYDIITLASIVEAETSLDHERGLVASVYVNRLRKNMLLQADPTVIYGLGGLERPLYRGDLRRDTPYNTYLHKGLPPTPINSPGLASIQAALNPDSSDYLYFVADNDGSHHFSRTNDEHNRAKMRIRSERNAGE